MDQGVMCAHDIFSNGLDAALLQCEWFIQFWPQECFELLLQLFHHILYNIEELLAKD